MGLQQGKGEVKHLLDPGRVPVGVGTGGAGLVVATPLGVIAVIAILGGFVDSEVIGEGGALAPGGRTLMINDYIGAGKFYILDSTVDDVIPLALIIF